MSAAINTYGPENSEPKPSMARKAALRAALQRAKARRETDGPLVHADNRGRIMRIDAPRPWDSVRRDHRRLMGELRELDTQPGNMDESRLAQRAIESRDIGDLAAALALAQTSKRPRLHPQSSDGSDGWSFNHIGEEVLGIGAIELARHLLAPADEPREVSQAPRPAPSLAHRCNSLRRLPCNDNALTEHVCPAGSDCFELARTVAV